MMFFFSHLGCQSYDACAWKSLCDVSGLDGSGYAESGGPLSNADLFFFAF